MLQSPLGLNYGILDLGNQGLIEIRNQGLISSNMTLSFTLDIQAGV